MIYSMEKELALDIANRYVGSLSWVSYLEVTKCLTRE